MKPLPLRFTASLAALLVLVPALALLWMPRPQAQGLARLLPQMALLQSLPALPDRPVPPLWRGRLGPRLADELWRRPRRLWWQAWGRHGDAGAYLIIPLPGGVPLAAAQLPPHSLQRDDLLVVAADPLALRLLQDQLRVVRRPLRGLDQRCLGLLEGGQAVFWKPAGLGGLAGPLAPLLQGYQEGCLALELDNTALHFRGEASASPDALLPPLPGADPEPPSPLVGEALLDLQGSTLEPLLQGLLSRQLVRDTLTARYGIGTGDLDLLRRLPFRLQVEPVARGPFQASLSLQLAAGDGRRTLARMLEGLRQRLRLAGLEEVSGAGAMALPASRALPAASWRRSDGVVVGGWRWLLRSGAQPDLLLYLGPEPSRASTLPPLLPIAGGPSSLSLRMRPAQLAAKGLWPRDWPPLLQRASQLELASRGSGSSLSRLQGRLSLAPLPPSSR